VRVNKQKKLHQLVKAGASIPQQNHGFLLQDDETGTEEVFEVIQTAGEIYYSDFA
jgi:hypothetical protein